MIIITCADGMLDSISHRVSYQRRIAEWQRNHRSLFQVSGTYEHALFSARYDVNKGII